MTHFTSKYENPESQQTGQRTNTHAHAKLMHNSSIIFLVVPVQEIFSLILYQYNSSWFGGIFFVSAALP